MVGEVGSMEGPVLTAVWEQRGFWGLVGAFQLGILSCKSRGEQRQ